MKCDICGCENGSCNRYETRDLRTFVICPTCLVFGMDERSKLARQLHKEGRLLTEQKVKERLLRR